MLKKYLRANSPNSLIFVNRRCSVINNSYTPCVTNKSGVLYGDFKQNCGFTQRVRLCWFTPFLIRQVWLALKGAHAACHQPITFSAVYPPALRAKEYAACQSLIKKAAPDERLFYSHYLTWLMCIALNAST